MTLTYVTPPGIDYRVMKGGHVAVCDRTGKLLSVEKVVKSGKTVMTLESGRKFRHMTGHWIGGMQDWPFPYVRQVVGDEMLLAGKGSPQ